MQFYCLNKFRAPICPSSGVQLINNFRFSVAVPGKRPGLCSGGLLGVSHSKETQAAFQVWPPKSGSYLLIVLLMMGILVTETW
jgi:hypothetical protein